MSSVVSSPTAPKQASGQSRIVKLRVSPSLLASFAPVPELKTKQSRKSGGATTSTPTTQVTEPSPGDSLSESNATPNPAGAVPDSNTLVPPANPVKRKGIPGPKPGSKRGPALTADGLPKPRGKPGPKKKPRLGDLMNGDPSLLRNSLSGATTIAQKLNPKANQGAINANLRALDRSGKPCRKWEKKGFSLKSFTGVVWAVPTWRAPKRIAVDATGEPKSDTSISSDAKANNENSAVPSEQGNSGGDVETPKPPPVPYTASSPVTTPAA